MINALRLLTFCVFLLMSAVPKATALDTSVGSLSASDVAVGGRILDPSGLPLPGVTVTLTPSTPGIAAATTTDTDGRFQITTPSGSYSLTADLEGFERVTRAITVGDSAVTVDITMRLAKVEQVVSVTAGADQPVLGEARAGAPAVVTREVIDTAMLPNNSVFDVLPLLPNVVRGPDGLVSVAGARAPQGQLLINGLTQNDPVLGEAAVMLPLDPVGSVQVLSHGYSSEFGRATGGVTQIEMRTPSDAPRFSINSFTPRLHFVGGRVRGIEAWEPNLGVSAPLVKGRLWLTQGLDYRFERTFFDTLAGDAESRYDAVLSWTAIEAQTSPDHRISTWVSFDPQTIDPANISAFTPALALPRLHRGGWRAAFVDRLVLGPNSTVVSSVQFGGLRTEVTPSGGSPYVLAHDLIRGNYFNEQDRDAKRLEVSQTWTHTLSGANGIHLLKAGGHLDYIDFSGVNTSGTVKQLRSDGTLARTIDFIGNPRLSASGYEAALFAQDSWAFKPDLTLDFGARYDQATVARGWVVAPRFAATWKVDPLTTLSGGVGVYSDKVFLAAAAFPSLQSRVVRVYDQRGALVGGRQTFANRLDGELRTPGAGAWHLQLDRRFEKGFIGRLTYQEQRGYREPVISVDDTAGSNALVLRSDGRSHARSLETTIGYRSARSGQSVYVSYVRSSSTGNLNDFVSMEGTTKEPFVQADAVGPLAADVPHRLLTWGVLKLPSRITVAPFLEVRSGFPYSAIDDEWNFVGGRNGRRFPTFASLDLSVNKIVKLRGSLPRAKIGVKLYNITGVNNSRDVQRDIARADFGSLYNPLQRQIRGAFELFWGQKD